MARHTERLSDAESRLPQGMLILSALGAVLAIGVFLIVRGLV